MSIVLPPTFPVVGLGVFSAIALNFYQMVVVVNNRKAAQVPYPTLYVSDADAAADLKKKKYNCAQRAHANTLESAPYILALYAFLSIFHPLVSTGLMITWVMGRVGYTMGYATGEPANRQHGFAKLHYVGLLGLMFGSLYVSASKTYALYF